MNETVTETRVSPPILAWLGRVTSPSKVSGIYVLIGLIFLFGIWVPDTFLSVQTFKNVSSGEAVTAIIALGLLFPLAAGTFDLSIGFTVGLSGMVAAKLLASGVAVPWAVAAAVMAGVAVGILNGLVVVGIGVDSFIATLGSGSIVQAITLAISDNQQIVGLPDKFGNIGNAQLFGVALPVYYLLILAVLAWYVLEHTPSGRFLYAIGNGREASRLAGIKTNRYIFTSLIVSSTVAALAGVIVSARLGSGSPSLGPNYLLPVFAAAFLGATQFHSGRINVWGTLLAVYLLATGVTGLQLAGAQFWITYLFNGVALIVAVSVGVLQIRVSSQRQRRNRKRQLLDTASLSGEV